MKTTGGLLCKDKMAIKRFSTPCLRESKGSAGTGFGRKGQDPVMLLIIHKYVN